MTRIVAISDTHGQHGLLDIPDGDLLVHAGDFAARGRIQDINPFNDWLDSLPHEEIIFVPGNHDFCFEARAQQETAINRLQAADVLIDQVTTVDGLKIWGSPWQPEFFDWAFNLPRGKPLREKWDLIPEDVDVLITHGPPFKIGDTVQPKNESVGCEDLRDRVREVVPEVHVFGHIHEGYGTYQKWDVTFVNASICDGNYSPINEPIVIDVEGKS
ncbi:MAG: metallophosphatase domain-containing protein [bacterium]